jgi:hypothetical protein
MSPSVRRNVLRRALDERGGRRVAHEVRHQLLGDEVRRRRVARENVEDLLAVLDAAPARYPYAEDHFLSRVVRVGVEGERRVDHRIVDAPAGEAARDFLHVLLRIPAVDAERVELHQLARVVLVHAHAAALYGVREQRVPERRMLAATFLDAPFDRVRMQAVDDALEVVEVVEHLGALRHRLEQIAELAQCVLADRAVVFDERERIRDLVGADGEVILPEDRHHLEELPVAGDGAHQDRRRDLSARGRPHRAELRQLLHEHRRLGDFRLERGGIHRRVDGVAAGLAADFRGVGLFADRIAVLVRLRMVGDQFEGRLVGDLEESEHAVGDRIRDPLGMELPVDPRVYAHPLGVGQIGSAGAEGQAVERLPGLGRGVEVGSARRRRPGGDWAPGTGAGRGHDRRDQQNEPTVR